MLVDQKRRLFILASDAHDLFMMTNRIDNAYYAVCGFMVFLDAFPNISQYFLIVFSSNKVLRGILMTSYRPAWCGNYTRVGINILLGIPIVCIVWYWPSKRLLYFICLISRRDRRQTNYSLCVSHINWHFFEREHIWKTFKWLMSKVEKWKQNLKRIGNTIILNSAHRKVNWCLQ